MSRPDTDSSYRPRTLVPARVLRPSDPSSSAAKAGFVVSVAAVVVAVAAASFPLAAVAVVAAYALVRAVVGAVRRRSRRTADGTTVNVPGVAVEVTVARTDGE
ncbi:hypothetical protein [Halopelagius longus]|uniref:Uncharacterized protein n=1 Tax=Halopelagius longus TaxID=1236180 RepID=A0A1H1B0V2_9EURY|nr:hypothetical protein [Halopelagius longus]SDQ45401.1 hypothetical protein SAMN05216278_1576 [Halopelagius longus]